MTEARTRSFFWRLARPLTAVGALLAVTALVGCADDEEVTPTPANGGSGGTATGAGGKATGGGAGKGGAAGAGGKAGSGGTAGTGGKAGAGGGPGMGGSSGSSGKGGTGGSTAGNGGSAGAAGGTGGSTGGTNTGGIGGTNTGGGGTGGVNTGGGGSGGSGGAAALCGPASGDGSIATAKKVAEDPTFSSPFDAVPSPDGCTVYFTAIATATGQGSVFSVKSDGSGLTNISNGGFIAPTGIAISTDGKTLFVADPGGAEDATAIGKDDGLIATVAASGGSPVTVVKGGAPISVTVAKESTGDQLYYGAFDSTTASWAVFKSSGSGAGTVSLSGLKGPGGIAILEPAGTIFAIDTGRNVLVTGTGAAPTTIALNIRANMSAGLALSADNASLVVSAQSNANGLSTVEKFALAGGAPTEQQPTNIQGLIEAAGLHRAANAEVYAWVDGLGTTKGGAVYVLSK